ncbi:hypothetical protein [Bradyrhizobium retamae]|uniref:hypothetical protein n=1 Tax=Bradyrhizobium retamae TaxID=1300035 RepID=UPI000A930885|nr:hypothetical protein [Bradyrhizobium retamae]
MFWAAGQYELGGRGFDSSQCDLRPLAYVNETRGFVMELRFPSWAGMCETGSVKYSIHLCQLLAIFVIISLVIAPLTARANTGAMAPMAMTATSDDAAMSDDMPCCPEKSAPVDCDQCPLMALCVSTTLQAPLQAGIAGIQPVTLRTLLPGSDPEVESLGYSPPPKPPRFLVLSA